MPAAKAFLFFFPTGLQGEHEFGSDAFGTDDVDVFLMRGDDIFCDRKPQTGAFFILAPGGVGFVETFPDLRQAFGGNADALILYRNKGFFMPHIGGDEDDRAGIRKLDRVVDQVVEDLLDLLYVRVNIKRGCGKCQVEGDTLIVAALFERCQDLLNAVEDVEGRVREQCSGFIDGVQVQEALRQLIQTVGLVEDDL